ncbi:cytochrome b [Coralloluteibacterium stylophorae]|uniref:Cytochrome b n=1 Tax=Coralloluteibacterium stylophorae TaxID=1776034 RepID=A0A8J7VT24_9GAMM|nr:cytochrome b [Coralloluteibacterium stylophorae]
MSRINRTRWGGVSQALHWFVALAILVLAVVGLVMGELPRTPRYFWVYDLHKSLGLTVLALMAVRLGWRLYAGAPPDVPMPTWQHRVAGLSHWLLYILAFAMPLSGWLYDSASGLRPLRWFGLAEVPKLAAPDPTLKAASLAVHEYGFWVLAVLVVVHAGAALWHHFVQRDVTLSRMVPRVLLDPPTPKDSHR